MPPRTKGKLLRAEWLPGATVALLAVLAGVLCLSGPVGDAWARFSYDLPFLLRPNVHVDKAVLVYLDEASHAELDQPRTWPWDRKLHAELIDKLSAEGAKAIVFDIVFPQPPTRDEAEAKLVDSIRKSRRTILSSLYFESKPAPGAETRVGEIMPDEELLAAAAGWGNANFLLGPDFGARQQFPNFGEFAGYTNVQSLPWAVARFVGAPATLKETGAGGSDNRPWLNYYGPPGSIPWVSYYKARVPGGTPPGFFKEKIVFIGALQSAGFSGQGKDEFRTPYSLAGQAYAPGVEVHATAALNLIDNNQLIRLGPYAEGSIAFLVAVLGGLGLMRAEALKATMIALAAVAAFFVTGCLMAWHTRSWFCWATPVTQISVILFCSIVFNSFRTLVQKRLLEESLAAHLSSKVLKRLVADPSLRQVGGSQQEVSILFTDIANFSRVSETMSPDDLVHLLNRYFETTLACVHETDGTVVKLIGDAIFAIWNAPIEQPDHRRRAARTALRLKEQLLEFGASQRALPLRTRVGLNAGIACVGNIGSATRFDYTAIGDSINLTARLEGLNKQLGTTVLASREVQRASEDIALWRLVGHFRLKGMSRAVEIHELLSPAQPGVKAPAWCDTFAAALHDFRERRFDAATAGFKAVIDARQASEAPAASSSRSAETGVGDGPSRFYLQKLEEFRIHPPPYEWIGEVEIGEK